MQMKLAKSSHPVADHNFEIVPAISPMEISTYLVSNKAFNFEEIGI